MTTIAKLAIATSGQNPVLAFKPYSAHPEDQHLAVVLREIEGGRKFVVHTFNMLSGGFDHGNYFGRKDYSLAIRCFNERGNA